MRENVEIVRRIFEGWATGNFGTAVAYFDPNVTLVVRPPFPEFGVTVGLERLGEYMRGFLAQFEHTTFEAEGIEAVGDTVLVRVVQHAKGRVSGIEGEIPFFTLFTFRGGKIVRMESVLDEAEAREAAGLSE
jgi:ketosteroid isomerase-like protein